MTAPAGDAGDERAARRVVVLFAVAVAAALSGVVVLVAGAGERSGTSAVDAIGPRPGTPVAGHETAARNDLARADGWRVAVVSFGRYATEGDARRAAAAAEVEVGALLVAAPGGAPAVVNVEAGLGRWAAETAAAARDEAAELARLLPTVDQDDFAAVYREDLAAAEAVVAALDADPAGIDLVFGLVVRGPAERLRALAAQPGIRLVDPAAGDRLADGAALHGLRPEETVRAGEPARRPVRS